jgi:hypothetical protein
MMGRERVLTFGPEHALSGVLTRPANGGSGGPAFLLLNAGLLHHAGPARLYVRLARRLAEAGVSSLRFDLPGLGDSPAPVSSAGADNDILQATLSAIEALAQATESPTCIAGGLCSASDNAFRAALATDRVIGLFQIDGWAHPTRYFYVRRFAPALARPDTWWRLLSGRLNAVRVWRSIPGHEGGDQADAEGINPNDRPFPSREWVADGYRHLVERGVRALAVFSGGRWSYYNYTGQLRDAYPEADLGAAVEEQFVAGADHMFTNEAHQGQVIEAALRFAGSLGPKART